MNSIVVGSRARDVVYRSSIGWSGALGLVDRLEVNYVERKSIV